MTLLKQSNKGIDGFFYSLFGFLRRKSDFFKLEDNCMDTIKRNFEMQYDLYKEDKARLAAIEKKKEAEKKKKEEEERKKKETEQ